MISRAQEEAEEGTLCGSTYIFDLLPAAFFLIQAIPPYLYQLHYRKRATRGMAPSAGYCVPAAGAGLRLPPARAPLLHAGDALCAVTAYSGMPLPGAAARPA